MRVIKLIILLNLQFDTTSFVFLSPSPTRTLLSATVAELKESCRAKGLKLTGNKADLELRLADSPLPPFATATAATLNATAATLTATAAIHTAEITPKKRKRKKRWGKKLAPVFW